MLRIFFGDVASGRLARLPFLAYTILLMLLVIIGALMAGAALGLLDSRAAGGDAAPVDGGFGGVTSALLTLAGLGVLFVHYNLVAKRARDAGLRGWAVVAVIVLVTGLAGMTLSEGIAAAVNGMIALALLLVPSGALTRTPA